MFSHRHNRAVCSLATKVAVVVGNTFVLRAHVLVPSPGGSGVGVGDHEEISTHSDQ